MLIFIVLILIAAIGIGIIAAILLSKYTYADGWACFCALFGVTSIIAVIVLSLTLINLDRRFAATINEYYVITAMVESYDGQDYGNMQSLTEAVVKINSIIAEHKAFYGNKWTGIWYSADIATLEPITFRKQTPLKE